MDQLLPTTRSQALQYTLNAQVQNWRKLVLSRLAARDVNGRLAELAWMSAITFTAYDSQMASAGRLLLHDMPIPQVLGALGARDVPSLLALWRPWAAHQSELFRLGRGVLSPQDADHVTALLTTNNIRPHSGEIA
ncbi:hypothetical protein ACIA8R_43840 [Nonomuraea sp. NPDC051191]|uniref:hypothetical protein n=1 Tax=Nonomuraea sp. NPDC051191 TaxID=3364372 RepID=UPI003798F183